MAPPGGEIAAGPDGRWPVLWITGPTACGKTELALAVAEALPVDLISVDSALVYRGLDIGSAKPGPELLARHPHALVDIRDPADPYTAAEFRRDALAALSRARAAGRLPVLVGGTMLYFRVLEQGLADMPASDPALRAELDAREARDGLAALHDALAQIDPDAAGRIQPTNPQRIKRALEVHALSGRRISEWWAEGADGADFREAFRSVRLALLPDDRARLHAAIERRFDAMLAAGLVDEVRGLMARGDLHADLPALRAVGYRQVWAHLSGACDPDAMREQALAATRQLARRQLTWLRGWQGLLRESVPPGQPLDPARRRALVAALAERIADAATDPPGS